MEYITHQMAYVYHVLSNIYMHTCNSSKYTELKSKEWKCKVVRPDWFWGYVSLLNKKFHIVLHHEHT